MKTIGILCMLSLVIGGILVWQAVRMPNQYGVFAAAPQADVAALIEKPAGFLHKTVVIEGTVREQCTAMGCFFFFLSGKDRLRVDLEQIVMNAPRKDGHVSRVEGQIVPYGDGYQFVASAVEFK